MLTSGYILQATINNILKPVPRARLEKAAYEDSIISFAWQLATHEKAASMLSVLSFVWATAVILGGFASDLKPLDFCIVSIILVLEGASILSRRDLLRWLRRLSSDNSYGFPFRFRDLSLQAILSLACFVLSLSRLIKHNYHRSDKGGTGNLKLALNGFYGLVLAESYMLMVQMMTFIYFVLIIREMSSSTRSEHSAISERITERSTISERSTEHITISVRSERDADLKLETFFYNSYLKCMEGETLMRTDDLTRYAVELLLSRSLKEQLWGARILCNLLTDREDNTEQMRRRFSLSKLENSSETLVKLIEMLRWEQKNSVDIPDNDDLSGLRRILERDFEIKKELRRFATNILLQFVTEDHHQNAHRLASFPGCLDSILSLLFESGDGSIPAGDRLNLKGLQLLEAITQKDDTGDTCDKIGNTPALLSKIIKFTAMEETIGMEIGMEETIIGMEETTTGLSLKVLLKLVQTEGPTGIRVRCNILENISIASNLGSILRAQNDVFRNYAIDILMYLAMDNKEARGKIGCVRGITDGLLTLFLNKGNDKAGEILYMLSLEHQDNCDRIAESTGEVMQKLLDTLHDIIIIRINNDKHKIVIYSANILRNIFAYGSPDVSELRNKDYTVLQAAVNDIQMPTHELLLESYLGLAVAIYMVIEETRSLFDVQKLMNFLEYYREPSIKVPCMRRYAIELATLMMDCNQESIATFRSKGLGEVLKGIRKTTSELESFYMFSGSIGPYSHEKTMYDLCRTATSYLSR